MNRFIPTLFVVITVFVFGSGQLGFAQVQILDGDGQQIAPNEIPAEKVDQPPADQVPRIDSQIFGGNGSSIVIRKSFRSVDENGDLKTESSGKAIVIGPDGKRQEFDLNDGEDQPLNFGGMRLDDLVSVPAAKEQIESFWLGLQFQAVPPAVASQLNLETGLMVSRALPGSPAATAGVQQYDIVLFADDKQLNSNADLAQVVQAAGEADANISFTLIRGGKEMSVAVKPEKRLTSPENSHLANGMSQIGQLEFGADGLFAEDALGDGMEARMRQRMERMQERVLRMQRHLGNGLLEMPRLPGQFRER